MPTILFAPVLLVSMPQMLDPNFTRTVVLLAEYGMHGAFGLVVNRRMAEPAHEVDQAGAAARHSQRMSICSSADRSSPIAHGS